MGFFYVVVFDEFYDKDDNFGSWVLNCLFFIIDCGFVDVCRRGKRLYRC